MIQYSILNYILLMGNQNCCGSINIEKNMETELPGEAIEVDKNENKQNIPDKIQKNLEKSNTCCIKQKENTQKQQNKNQKTQGIIIDEPLQDYDENKISEKDIFQYSHSNPKVKTKEITSFINIDPTSFMRIKQTPIQLQYQIQNLISKGQEGQVYKAKYLPLNEARAIKKINKMKINQEQTVKLIKQFQFLERLDHPHIIKLYDIYEDTYYFYVATEICQGGNLLNVLNTTVLSMQIIKQIMHQLLGTLNYMHQLNILHRDIKLQNIIIVKNINQNKKQIPLIKVIDFDLSIDLNTIQKDINGSYKSLQFVGTLLYMPPQAFQGFFNISWDIWSCGVVLWMLITKKLPYKFKSDNELKKCISKLRFQQKYLLNIDKETKQFLYLFFEPNRFKRLPAAKLLQHKWFTNIKNLHHVSKETCNIAAQNLVKYNRSNNLISIVESFMISKRINQEKRLKLAQIFNAIDKDNSGIIEITELKKFMKQSNINQSQQQIESILKMIDKDGSGTIGFHQFITIMYNRKQLFTKQSLEQVFQFYDIDRSGDINRQELKLMMKGVNPNEIQQIFVAVDLKKDNKITKDQWYQYLLKQTNN